MPPNLGEGERRRSGLAPDHLSGLLDEAVSDIWIEHYTLCLIQNVMLVSTEFRVTCCKYRNAEILLSLLAW